MPMIVRCIDDYFTQKRRDLYFIVFGKEDGEWRVSSQLLADNDDDLLADERSDPPGREEMLAWLAEHLPQVKVAPLFTHTWDSGIISVPYDGTISVDFDDASLATFSARWEDGDGNSIDTRMQCYFMPLAGYLRRHGA